MYISCSGGWTISGTPLELDPRLLAIAEAERHFLEAEYDDYAASSASGAAYCRSVALIVSSCISKLLYPSEDLKSSILETGLIFTLTFSLLAVNGPSSLAACIGYYRC